MIPGHERPKTIDVMTHSVSSVGYSPRLMESAPPNPYDPPGAVQSGLQRPLYDVRHITIATFLGSPLAGAIVMALNYRRLAPDKVVSTIALGVVASAATFGLAFILPDDFPNVVLPAAYTAAMASIAGKAQGGAIEQARTAGEPPASGWRSAGIGLATLAALAVLVVGILFASPEDKVVLGAAQQHEIYFEDGATEQDARKLHGALTELGFFGNHPATATIKREDGGWLVTVVLVEGAWNDAEVIMSLRELAGDLGTKLGGRVRIAIADMNLKVRKTVDAG